MNNDVDYDPYAPYQGILIDTEKTPDQHGHKQKVEQEYVPGIYRNCYICGIDVARLPQDQIMSIVYTVEETRSEPERKYVLTYCTGCYTSHLRK